MKKLIYLANIRLPTEKAHGIQIMKMCEAFADAGTHIELVVPKRINNIKENPFIFYGVRHNFKINYVPTFDALSFFRGSRLGFYVQAASFLCALRRELVACDMIIITRNPEIAWWYGRKGYRVFYDAHNFPSRRAIFLKRLLKNIAGIVANSNGTAEAFRGIGFLNILVAPNAVDLELFKTAPQKNRNELGLPRGRIAMYVGHLYKWKGVDTVIDAAHRSKEKDLIFVFVGGTNKDIARYRKETHTQKNVLFLGFRPPQEVPDLIKSADVLLLPNIPATQESLLYTSPIKMFEYMASGIPIVASDMPSIREVLNDKNAILIKAGNSADLLRGIEQALKSESKDQAVCAKEDVKKYTWDARARKILDFIKHQ